MFVVRDGKHATRVRVEPGSSDGGQVEIRSGLKAGEQVVSAGAGFLSDGDLIRIVAVSYTHLDVYKRQLLPWMTCWMP